MQAIQNKSTRQILNTIAQGDCIKVMRQMPANSVDFILTDPPYLVNYCDRSGRSIQNDVNADWLKPAMKAAYRVLKQGPGRSDVLRLEQSRCLLRSMERRGFSACRTHRVSQEL